MTTASVKEQVRVRTAPRIAPDTMIGMLPEKAVIDVKRVIDVGGFQWAEFDLVAGGVAVGNAYSAAMYLDFGQAPPPPPPPPQPPQPKAAVRVGVNALNRHEEVCAPALNLGCRYFVVLNNPGYASKIKDDFPDATVMVRIFWDRRIPGVDEAINRMDGCRDARLVYTGLNEADECPQDFDGIRRRAEFDVALATRIKQISGATYAAGTFSMGTPDFTNGAINDLIRQVYAPHYNSGLISWDHHLYSPVMDHIFRTEDLIWFETRWRFLFTHCGFDPASPSRVYCSETGEDEGGVGGFPAHNRSADQVQAWAAEFIRQQSMPLVIGGREFPSPFVGGALFQAGNRESGPGGWAGYNVEPFYANLSAVWKLMRELRPPARRASTKRTAKKKTRKPTRRAAPRKSAKKAAPPPKPVRG